MNATEQMVAKCGAVLTRKMVAELIETMRSDEPGAGESVDIESQEMLVRVVGKHFEDAIYDTDADCATCIEDPDGTLTDRCPRSKRPCGHHCNCSWTQDVCCWCEKEFDGEPVIETEET